MPKASELGETGTLLGVLGLAGETSGVVLTAGVTVTVTAVVTLVVTVGLFISFSKHQNFFKFPHRRLARVFI